MIRTHPWSKSDFNPRSREGSDLLALHIGFGVRISIHAPVKGATCVRKGNCRKCRISIHAPVKGATRVVAIDIPRFLFQSTLP